jgi:hypothetical protein
MHFLNQPLRTLAAALFDYSSISANTPQIAQRNHLDARAVYIEGALGAVSTKLQHGVKGQFVLFYWIP